MRSGQWHVAKSFFKLPDALQHVGDQPHRPARRCGVLFGRAADVYARMIQCKAPFRGEDHDGWSHARRGCCKDWERWTGSCYGKRIPS